MQDITREDFATGLFYGITRINESPDGWLFLKKYGHLAAREAFGVLSRAEWFDLRFNIILHPVYRHSGDWHNMVFWHHNVTGLLVCREPQVEEFEIIASRECPWPSNLPGHQDMWEHLARVYVDAYQQAFTTSPA